MKSRSPGDSSRQRHAPTAFHKGTKTRRHEQNHIGFFLCAFVSWCLRAQAVGSCYLSGTGRVRQGLSKRLRVRRTQDAEFRDDPGDVAMRCDVERRVARMGPFRGDPRVTEVRDLALV